MAVRILTTDMASPEDMTGIETMLAELGPQRVRRLAILAKLEASAPNDYSCEPTRRALHAVLTAAKLVERTTSLLAVGCEGIATPFAYLLADIDEGAPRASELRLAMGFGTSAPVAATDRGRAALLSLISDTVLAALRDGDLTPASAGLILVKTPTVPAGTQGATPEQTSMRRGRSLGALGAGIALRDIDAARVTDTMIGVDRPAECATRHDHRRTGVRPHRGDRARQPRRRRRRSRGDVDGDGRHPRRCGDQLHAGGKRRRPDALGRGLNQTRATSRPC